MSKILVPTDFSATARNAIGYALRLALQTKSDLVIFHANPPESGRIDVDVQKDFDFLRKDIEAGFKGGLQVEYFFEDGNLLEVLQHAVKRYKPDLILMGTNGKSGNGVFKIGSNAYAVVDNCQVPVLVVPPEVEFVGMSKLVLALDFNLSFSTIPQLPLLQLLNLLGGQLYILSVISNDTANKPEAITDVQKIQTLLKSIPHSYHYVYHDDIDKAIMAFCELHHADALIMLPQKHSWVRKMFNTTHTQNLVYDIKTPVLSVKGA